MAFHPKILAFYFDFIHIDRRLRIPLCNFYAVSLFWVGSIPSHFSLSLFLLFISFISLLLASLFHATGYILHSSSFFFLFTLFEFLVISRFQLFSRKTLIISHFHISHCRDFTLRLAATTKLLVFPRSERDFSTNWPWELYDGWLKDWRRKAFYYSPFSVICKFQLFTVANEIFNDHVYHEDHFHYEKR